MQSLINIPEHKRALVSKVCLDELLWGNEVEGPILISENWVAGIYNLEGV